MRPYHPSDGGADLGRELTVEEIRAKAAAILKEMDEEEVQHGPGLCCPKCGGQMAHYRLYGYRCIRGCQS
jgi:hypothetical protein